MEEDLQAQLDQQQKEASTVEIRALLPSEERTNTDNEDESSMETEDQSLSTLPTSISTTSTPASSNMQPWPAQIGIQFPRIPSGSWKCIDNPYITSPFPSIDYHQDSPHLTIEADFHITPMMHNDLYVLDGEE